MTGHNRATHFGEVAHLPVAAPGTPKPKARPPDPSWAPAQPYKGLGFARGRSDAEVS